METDNKEPDSAAPNNPPLPPPLQQQQPPPLHQQQQAPPDTGARGPTDEDDRLSGFGSPKHGPTLSTSTSSFEALDPHDPNLSHLASLMFSHTSNYLQGELSAVLEDYALLEQMNKATITKYADMRQIGGSVSRALKDLNDKYLALHPYLEQIDQIEDSVTKLERAAYKLDEYSKRLETKFKTLEKK